MSYEAKKRWRLLYPEKRNESRNKNYDLGAKMARPRRNGEPWTDEEIRLVLNKPSDMTDREVAKAINRTVRAVQIKRCRERR